MAFEIATQMNIPYVKYACFAAALAGINWLLYPAHRAGNIYFAEQNRKSRKERLTKEPDHQQPKQSN